MQANGSERKIPLSLAESMVDCGTADHAGHKDGLPCIVEQRQATYRDRYASLWVKDRGITGGRYGRPMEPNGKDAQMMMVRQ